MPTPMLSDRRALLGAALGGLATLALPRAAFALTDAQAKALIGRAIDEVNGAIDSGKTGEPLYALFETIFTRYADVPTIARSALGSAARTATPAQMAAFTTAFRGYISRKYGKRFREFIGGRFEVQGARAVKGFYEVKTTAILQGQAPFEVLWHVSDKSGKDLFFNIIIEGVNMLAAERTEIGSMLDARRGNIDALITDLKTAG
ncbi:MAG: phospholipid-binding protein MlaC [Paenirhodobacter sp.]|uniref:MlaC/ttg2D family ABC transporter substrate-binding protein n=1 Tax=Paenirhodobacter sp. TaxID=1965326 RepID=UPI003D12A9AC